MTFLTAAALLIIFSAPARAYIDPGSGSYLLQVSLAGLLAVVYSIKLYWRRIKAFASGLRNGHAQPESRVTHDRRG